MGPSEIIEARVCHILLFSIILILEGKQVCSRSEPVGHNLFVISFDGMRYDYINATSTPNIFQIRSKGTWAKAMLNVFPTKTFTNHFTMVTGMYPGSHGVLDSSVRENGKLIKYSKELFKSNSSTLPIWTQAEKAGIKSMIIYWTGSDFSYDGVLPSRLLNYKKDKATWEENVDKAVKFLEEDSKPRLAMLYLNEPDSDAHAFGSDSPQVQSWIKKADNLVEYVNKKVNSANTNVVIVSDHGMDTVTFERVVDLNKYVGDSLYDTAGTSPCLQIFPKPDKYREVLGKIQEAEKTEKKFKIYEKSQIPSDWKYAYSPRAPPILILNEPGYGLQDFFDVEGYKKLYNLPENHKWSLGSHGYHPVQNPKMLAIFFAWGPDVRRNVKLPQIVGSSEGVGARTIDLYGLWCQILNLQCRHQDGSMTNLAQQVLVPQKPQALRNKCSHIFNTRSNILYISIYYILISVF